MSEMEKARAKKPEAKRENKVSQTQKTGPSQSISSPVEQILFLQRTIGNQAVGRLLKSGALQAKLRIGQPGDIYEQEADRMAEQVMRMPEPEVSNETKVSNPAGNNSIQHKCPWCKKGTKIEKEEEDEKLQKKEATGSTHEVTPELESSISAIRGGGQPLPEPVRAFYETRFGADFRPVRVHTGSHAAETARSINARAFTVGNNIAFGEGQFAPGSHEGRKLLAHELTHTIQQDVPAIQRQEPKDAGEKIWSNPISSTSPGTNKVAFVREEGLNLRERTDQKSTSLATLKFGQRVHTIEDPRPQPGWQKVAVLGRTGYVFGPRIHFPPEHLIQKDPGLNLIKVKSGQTFWGLVKEMYGIQGNESTLDQNINHFINAIRVVNKPEAFNITTDFLDDVGNFFISGRDATDTLLIAGVDLWIPSYGVAARMDVGSGTIRGEITRFVKKIEQKIDDFKEACQLSGKYIPAAIARHAGEMAEGLLNGLIEFAIDALKIMAVSTAVGALIGALFGGVGALPGAEIGFEIGLLILEYYGLFMLIEAVLGVAVDLLSQLGQFIKLVWTASGDKKQLEEAARSLADALGILVSAVLVAIVAYFLKKGTEAFMKTKFAKTVGERPLAQWLKQRQEMQTTKGAIEKLKTKPPTMPPPAPPTSGLPPGIRESAGASPRGSQFQSASAQTPRSVITAVRADVAESQAYMSALQRGEIGLQRPGGANVPGTDFITARITPSTGVEVIVTDVKASTVGRFPTPATTVPPAWMAEVQAAVAPGRLNLGDPVLEGQIRAAVNAGNIRPRQVNVNYSPTPQGQGSMTGF